MVRGNGLQSKVIYKGDGEDFIVFVEDPAALKQWKTDKTIALTNVVDAFKIFITGGQGAQGVMNTASKATLENEFGTHNEDEVITQILEKGTLQETENHERQANTNETIGARNNF